MVVRWLAPPYEFFKYQFLLKYIVFLSIKHFFYATSLFLVPTLAQEIDCFGLETPRYLVSAMWVSFFLASNQSFYFGSNL